MAHALPKLNILVSVDDFIYELSDSRPFSALFNLPRCQTKTNTCTLYPIIQ